jgi:hypothetical protein
VSNAFVYWFCDLSDVISGFLVSMIMAATKQKGIPKKFVELASNHSATISLLEVWNYYGHWIPLRLDLNKNMPYLFYHCAFEISNTTTDKQTLKYPLPENVYSNTVTVVKTLFYLTQWSGLIQRQTGDFEHFFQSHHQSSSPETEGNYLGLTKLGLLNVQHFGPKFKFHRELFDLNAETEHLDFSDNWSCELTLLESLLLLLDSSYKGTWVKSNQEKYRQLDDNLRLIKDINGFMNERKSSTWLGRFFGKSIGDCNGFYMDMDSARNDSTEDSTRRQCLQTAEETVAFLRLHPTGPYSAINYASALKSTHDAEGSIGAEQNWELAETLDTKSTARKSKGKQTGVQYLPNNLIATSPNTAKGSFEKNRDKTLELNASSLVLFHLVTHIQNKSDLTDGCFMYDETKIGETISTCISQYSDVKFGRIMGPDLIFWQFFQDYTEIIPAEKQEEKFTAALKSVLDHTVLNVKQEACSIILDGLGNRHPHHLELDKEDSSSFTSSSPTGNARKRAKVSGTEDQNDHDDIGGNNQGEHQEFHGV